MLDRLSSYKITSAISIASVFTTQSGGIWALELAPGSIDLAAKVIVFRNLKKHKNKKSFRAVPVPASLLDTLDLVHKPSVSLDVISLVASSCRY
jgi:hypothetical protein